MVALPAALARQNDTLALLQPLPGTTITEQFTITHRLEPTRKKPSAETPSEARGEPSRLHTLRGVDTSVLASALKHHAVAGVVVGAE